MSTKFYGKERDYNRIQNKYMRKRLRLESEVKFIYLYINLSDFL